MRILIASTHRGMAGGIETYLMALLPALVQRGHEPALLYEQPAPPGTVSIDGDTCSGRQWWAGGEQRDEALRRAAAWRPDVVLVNALEAVDLEEELQGLAPAVLFAHGYHGTCISGTKRRELPQVGPCGRTLDAACLALYLPCRCGGLNPLSMLRLFAAQRRRLRLLRRYRAVVVASSHMRGEYRCHGIEEERLRLAPLFPPGYRPDPSPPHDRPATGRVLLVGRLTREKGGDFLIEAVRLARQRTRRDLSLLVAGDGPERDRLEALARRRDAPAQFLGWVDRPRCIELMRQADLLAVPSTWPEPFGLVGVEAGCVGLPAVGYPVGGIPDWLVPGESGELAPAGPPTPEGLAAAIGRALADPAHLQQLRVGAWRMAGRFTLEQHLARLEAACEEAAQCAGGPADAQMAHPYG
jgi:glycosyltransferase involved in cell wall biosynthesis